MKDARVGDEVRVKGYRGSHRVVESLMEGDFGGCVLNEPVDGIRFWNESDLVLRRRPKDDARLVANA